MPDVKLGSEEEMIGCLKVKGCMWSTPCECYNCKTFNTKKLKEQIKILSKNKKYKKYNIKSLK